jgi:regulation of enolase protein 1 (concanavalin A-like superfamily)
MISTKRRRRSHDTFVGVTLLALSACAVSAADDGPAISLPFRDTFRPKPDAGWRWVREDPKGWRVGAGGLEVRVGSGNMWGPANDAKNVLVRPAPDPKAQPVEITASVANKPTNQWEQVDLVWYYDDANMVKLGQELVDGQLSIVMGREQADKTRTIAIIPLESDKVRLCLQVRGDRVRGRYKTPAGDWKDAGECDLPLPKGGRPHVSLQFYRGAPGDEHWARVEEVTVTALQ